MSSGNELLEKKWNIIKDQLIVLCGLKKLPEGNEEFATLLKDDFQLKNVFGYTEKMNAVCYFVLGIIDFEERNKLIQWPLINIKSRTKFRKGVAALVKGFQEKYPWAHVTKIPESYFLNLQNYQSKAIDFLLRLTNLAIHIALDDPEILMMHSGEKLSTNEIEIMIQVISKARENEEKIMKHNVIPINEIEAVKNDISYKCISLIQLNDDLQQELNSLTHYAHTEKIIPVEKKIDINELRKRRDETLFDLSNVNEELSAYYKESQELLSKVKQLKNPVSLSIEDFGCKDVSPDLIRATSKVCGDLCQLFKYIATKRSTKDEEDQFYEQLKAIKKALMEQNKELNIFLHQMDTNKGI